MGGNIAKLVPHSCMGREALLDNVAAGEKERTAEDLLSPEVPGTIPCSQLFVQVAVGHVWTWPVLVPACGVELQWYARAQG